MRMFAVGLLLAAGASLPASAWAQDQDQRGRAEGGHWRDGGGGRSGGGAAPIAPPGSTPTATPSQSRPAPPQGQPALQARADEGRGGGRFDRGRFGGDRGGSGRYAGGDRAFGRESGDAARAGDRAAGGRIDDPARGTPGGWNRPRPDRGGLPIASGYGGDRAQPGQPGYRGGYSDGDRAQGRRFGGDGADPRGGYPNAGYRPTSPRPAPGSGWNRGWRDDRRYDVRSYRLGNRDVFHLGRYDAPREWSYGYRRFSPGFTLSPFLFDQDYWIDDPYAYRLPPAWRPYRWVRYYGDALLVDVRTGEVVDAEYGIFW